MELYTFKINNFARFYQTSFSFVSVIAVAEAINKNGVTSVNSVNICCIDMIVSKPQSLKIRNED